MTSEQAIALIRERAQTDHPALLRALDALLDDKRDSMRTSAGFVKHANRGYAKAYENAAEHIEEAIFDAFEIWPDESD